MDNMDTKQIVTGIVTFILAVTAAVMLQKTPAVPNVNVNMPPQAQAQNDVRYGSVASPDIPSPYLRWGGLGPIWHFSESPAATTTSGVFCSFAVPVGTSTVTFASWRPDNTSGSFGASQIFDISTSTLVSGSSTPALIYGASFSAGQIWEPISTSSSPSAPTFVLYNSANTVGALNAFTVVSSIANPLYLNFRVATSSAGSFANYPTGNCQAEFVQI